MYVFKGINKEIGVNIVETDYINHKVTVDVYTNLNDDKTSDKTSFDFELRFVNGRSFVRFSEWDAFEYTRRLDDALSSNDVKVNDDIDIDMKECVSFIQSLREATVI